jgi:hypothetical protein
MLHKKEVKHLEFLLAYFIIYTMAESKSKDELVPVIFLTEHHAMKAYSESGSITPRIL